jgi:hypothetical protein
LECLLINFLCIEILGVEKAMKDVPNIDCFGAVMDALHATSKGVHGVLQHISPTEQIPSWYRTVSDYLAKLPMVVDWMKRSVFRRGAMIALVMSLLHYPEDFELQEVTEGYATPSERRLKGQHESRANFLVEEPFRAALAGNLPLLW